MGFVVEPYCFFLSYEITDSDAAARLLPPHYRLVPTAMFADETPRLCAIVGAFTVHTSVFWGTRVELYVIAEDTRSGMLTWVICDYESNTINYGPGEGFARSTTERAVVTTVHTGDVVIDVRSAERPNHLEVTAALPAAKTTPLEQRLWIEGNLSVDYGGRLRRESSEPFGLVFDPDEMRQALRASSGCRHGDIGYVRRILSRRRTVRGGVLPLCAALPHQQFLPPAGHPEPG